MILRDVATVNFQGIVVAFARGDADTSPPVEGTVSTDIFFNVLALEVDSTSDALDWNGFTRLSLPDQVRPAGMNLISVPIEYDRDHAIDGLEDAGQPFRVITNQEYIYLIRQAKKGTLLVNRLRLVRGTAAANPQEVRYTLQPAWEVRFQRSGKADVPADDRDSQAYLAPDRTPFFEPAIELAMVGNLVDGNFDALFLSRGEGTLLTCVVFVTDATGNKVDVYELQLDATGRFILGDKPLTDGVVAPDLSFQVADDKGVLLALSSRPAAALYLKQERVRQAGGDQFLIKRSGRVLLALTGAIAQQPPVLVTIDLAAAADGTIAAPAAIVRAAPVDVANYTLDFDAAAYATLTPWTPTGGYSVDLWLYPRALDLPVQQILGGLHDPDAPYLRLVDGTALEVGFLGVNNQRQTARTAAGAVRQLAWSHVQVSFAPAMSPPFTIRINDAAVALTSTGTGDVPARAIDGLSAPISGFIGSVDQLMIYGASGWTPESLVGAWSFDTIDYVTNTGAPIDPPTSPNSKDPAAPARIFGAHLIPSTSPTATSSGALSWDARGLSIYAAYFADLASYGALNSAPCLLAGSDGLVHCYFRGRSDAFSVMQLDTETARATFALDWQTAAVPPPRGAALAAETGKVQLVATQAGAFMNTAVCTVAAAAAGVPPSFCDVTLVSPSGRTETWAGVPRSLDGFVATLAGGTVDDPQDARIATFARTFYDVAGAYPAAYLAIAGNAAAAALGVVGALPGAVALAGVEVIATGTTATLHLTFTAPRFAGVTATATWTGVPTRIGALLDTLRGTSTTYGYHAPGSFDLRSYSLTASSGLVAANRVVVFTHPSVTAVATLAITPCADPLRASITMSLTDRVQGALTATWAEVPRAQTVFGAVLEGIATPAQYDYAAHATGDWAKIGSLLVIGTDGSSAALQDTPAAPPSPLPPDDDLRVAGALVAVFTTAACGDAEVIGSTAGVVAATTFQHATATVDGQAAAIAVGSSIVRALPATVPSSGAVGLVANSTGAPLTLQGYNGGWQNQPDNRTLGFAWDGWVAFETDEAKAPSIDAITIPGDLTLELWCRPTRSREDFDSFQRLLTFSRTASGGQPVQFLAGLVDCNSLQFAKDTAVRRTFNSTAGTFYTWFNPCAPDAGTPTGIIGSLGTVGAFNPILLISLDATSVPTVQFTLDAAQPAITGPAPIAVDSWHALAVTFASSYTVVGSRYQFTFAVALAVDGVVVGARDYTILVQDKLIMGNFIVGDGAVGQAQTLPMYANEMAYFDRPLTADELETYAAQRIPDNAPALIVKWMAIDNTGGRLVNTAPTGADFDTDVTPKAVWQDYGLYARPVLGHGANVAILTDDPIIHGWSHLALVHQAGYALRLGGRDYADCGHDESLNLGDTFSLEAWVRLAPRTSRAPQAVLAKGDDYAITIDVDGRPTFAIAVKVGDKRPTFAISGAAPIAAGVPTYLAATCQIVSVQVPGEGQTFVPRYEARLALYANGAVIATGMLAAGTSDGYAQYADPVTRVLSTASLNLGRSSAKHGSSYLRGELADVRVWTRVLGASEIEGVYASRRAPASDDGLVSWWRFAEADGRVAFDGKGQNNATLSRGDLRELFQPTANNWFFVDGRAARTATFQDSPAVVGGYGATDQFLMGKVDDTLGFYGQLDDVRLWNTQLTGEQIADAMHRPPTGGEPHLRGYWGFDGGSGPVLEDQTGRGNRGTLVGSALPQWGTSAAPLGNEAEVVLNILGGIPTFAQRDITATPSVIEYADVERDAYGELISVMKRAYVSVTDGEVALVTGYKIGDLDTVYLGQAQSRPTLIGFIEGAPPIPSENQTMPGWLGGYGSMNSYAGASQVAFTEADNTVFAYNAERETSDTHAFTVKGGLYAGGQYGTATGIGFEVEIPVAVGELHLGVQGGGEWSTHTSTGVGVQTGTTVAIATGLKPGGAWEPGTTPASWVNPVVGRRFVPNNNGLALVKSMTVDVYASILRATGAMVKMSMVPNPDIPVDVNLIDFPIDPTYVKNGTLDGKVGLRNDPTYPNADRVRGSYFKPLEAYTWKRRIDRQTTELEAYYAQYDEGRYAKKLGDAGAFDDYRKTVENNASYDWAQHLSKRSICNTYVWTAGGGTYAQATQNMNVYSEQHGSVSSSQWSLGAVGDVQLAFPVAGFYLDFDYLYTSATQVNVVKSEQQGATFDLAAAATPEQFLYAPIIDPATGSVDFGPQPAEGKVDGYRYLAFYLAPSPDHGDTFQRVVDPNWLANSNDAEAAALREATVTAAGPWRVFYRVTYVSRIPPRFQPVPTLTQAPDLRPPSGQAYNAVLIKLIEAQLTTQDPTPVELGVAINAVLGVPDAPGVLRLSLPWWGDFLNDTKNYALPAAKIVRALREDLLAYMIARAATKAEVANG
jgi:hypothetical protein